MKEQHLSTKTLPWEPEMHHLGLGECHLATIQIFLESQNGLLGNTALSPEKHRATAG